MFEYFTMIDNDGINLGIRNSFSETWLEFDNEEEEAVLIILEWNKFIRDNMS